MSTHNEVFSDVQRHLERSAALPHATPAGGKESDVDTIYERPWTPETEGYGHIVDSYDVRPSSAALISRSVSPLEPTDVLQDSTPYRSSWVDSAQNIPRKSNYAMGFAENEHDEAMQLQKATLYPDSRNGSDISLADPTAPLKPQGHFTWTNDELLERRIDESLRGIGRQSYPYLSWFLSFGIVAVFVAELIVAKQLTGQAIQTHPNVQPMIGPAPEFMIYFGARFVPCMRSVPKVPVTNRIPCLQYTTTNSTTFFPDQLCPLSQVCGLNSSNQPNQGYRFVSAVELFVCVEQLTPDILFNLVVMLTLCAQIEKLIGTPLFAVVFMAGGIGGNLLGGNFGLIGQPAMGASGAVYTCISFEIMDLLYNWRYEMNVRSRVITSVVFAILGLALGLLPGLDNFAHIGGFCVGILSGLVFAPAIHATRRQLIVTTVSRVVGLSLLVAFFVALVLTFYRSEDPSDTCHWCRYLSCLPMFDACKGVGITTTTPDGQTAT